MQIQDSRPTPRPAAAPPAHPVASKPATTAAPAAAKQTPAAPPKSTATAFVQAGRNQFAPKPSPTATATPAAPKNAPQLQQMAHNAEIKGCFTLPSSAPAQTPAAAQTQQQQQKSFFGIKLPELKLPHIALPNIKLPDIKLPELKLPHVDLPHLGLPKLPDIKQAFMHKLLGTDYPTTPQARATEEKRIMTSLAEPLSKLSPQQNKVLDQMRAAGMSNVDIFRGAHAVTNDGGKLYDEWKNVPGARERTSSHYPGLKTQQYEIEYKGAGVLLFGKDKSGNTWFQMEAHSTKLQELPAHMLDYLKHQISGHQNIGPAGYSPHSEKEGTELHLNYPAQG